MTSQCQLEVKYVKCLGRSWVRNDQRCNIFLRFCGPGKRKSRGPKPKSLQKISKKSLGRPAPGPKVRPKRVSKKVRKVAKIPVSDFLETSQTLFETLFRPLEHRNRKAFLSSLLFETLWLLAPRRPLKYIHHFPGFKRCLPKPLNPPPPLF